MHKAGLAPFNLPKNHLLWSSKMVRKISCVVSGLVLLTALSFIAHAVPDQATLDRINEAAKRAQGHEAKGTIFGEAQKAWQEVLDLVDASYPIDERNVNGKPTFDPRVGSDGQAKPNDRTVQIGRSGMRSGGNTGSPNAPFSPGWLGAVKLHEVTHVDQFVSGTWTDEPVNRHWHEILAYIPVIDKAKNFGLTKKERDEFLRRAKNDLIWMKMHIRSGIARGWEREKAAGNIALSNEWVKLFQKIERVIKLEQQGQEVAALKYKLEIKKEIDEAEKTATGASLDRLKELEKHIDKLIKAEEVVEKLALTNHLRDAEEASKGVDATAIGLLPVYVQNMIKEELKGNLKEALKYKKELLKKLKKARSNATKSGNSGAAKSLRDAEEELRNLIRKEEAQIPGPPGTPSPPRLPVPPPSPTPVPPPPPPPTPLPQPEPVPSDEPGTTPTPKEAPPSTPPANYGGSVSTGFSSLTGEISVNRAFLGDVKQVVLGTEENGSLYERGKVRLAVDDRTVRIGVDEDVDLDGIRLYGTQGTVDLYRQVPQAPQSSSLTPLKGIVKVMNGVITATFVTPPGTLSGLTTPSEYTSMIDGEMAPVVATRAGEVALFTSQVPLPLDADTNVFIGMPDGTVVAGDMPSWGFRVTAQPTVEVNEWAPIYLECAGLLPHETLRIEFKPLEGQTIEPLVQTRTCGETYDLQEIAQYKAGQAGHQKIVVEVTRNGF